jgi:hypothetical protein
MTQKRKGSATAPTVPSHGPNIPRKDIKMNAMTNTTSATNVKAPLIHQISEDDLEKLTMKELGALYDAYRLIGETLCAALNQPKFIVGRSNMFNAAGDLADNLDSHLSEVISAIVSVANAAHPTTVEAAEHKAWILFKFEASCADDVPLFLKLAAEQNLAVSEAEFAAKQTVRKGA